MSLDDPSQVGEARRIASALAARLGFGERERGVVALITTEAASNVLRHAERGRVVIRQVGTGERPGVELLALDRGPGISDLPAALRDGFSTGGTMGAGLGSIGRMSAQSDIFTGAEVGTALLARIWGPAGPPPAPAVRAAGLSITRTGEMLCGDGWIALDRPDGALVVVVDGLGHGPAAHDAAEAALQTAEASADQSPGDLLELTHSALQSTRGAAVAVAQLMPSARQVRFAGVGNVSAVLVSHSGTRSLLSHHGIVGHRIRKVQEVTEPWSAGTTLLLYSDGLASQWRLDAYPGLLRHDPALLAAVLYRDHARGRDDVTVVACRAGVAG